MNTEQFEQAKRKYIHSVVVSMRDLGAVIEIDEIEKFIDAGVSDLTALLEQHKEVMKEELRQKLLSMRSTKEAMDKLDADDKLMQYGYHDCINEMLMWLKNVKKS